LASKALAGAATPARTDRARSAVTRIRMIISLEIIYSGMSHRDKQGMSAPSVTNDPPLTILPWALPWSHRYKTRIASPNCPVFYRRIPAPCGSVRSGNGHDHCKEDQMQCKEHERRKKQTGHLGAPCSRKKSRLAEAAHPSGTRRVDRRRQGKRQRGRGGPRMTCL
jgi:hypothetical protein